MSPGPADGLTAAQVQRDLGEQLRDRARLLSEGRLEVPSTRDAATVVLLRDTPDGPEAYLLRRVRAMAFAGGMHVFPGGSVDPADSYAGVDWAGPPPTDWARWFSCEEPLARALVCAAVRETFEESGVLLAGPSADEVLADVSTDEWEAERHALESREQTLSQLLRRRGLVLRADLLRPLAHWITPEVEPKRFDTRFFLAGLPDGQTCREAGSEADARRWVRPGDAAGLTMLPPTRVALDALAAARTVAEALATPRTIVPVMPRLEERADGSAVLVLPDGTA